MGLANRSACRGRESAARQSGGRGEPGVGACGRGTSPVPPCSPLPEQVRPSPTCGDRLFVTARLDTARKREKYNTRPPRLGKQICSLLLNALHPPRSTRCAPAAAASLGRLALNDIIQRESLRPQVGRAPARVRRRLAPAPARRLAPAADGRRAVRDRRRVGVKVGAGGVGRVGRLDAAEAVDA